MGYNFYAVKKGRKLGIFDDWEVCKAQVHRYEGARYKGFGTFMDAKDYLKEAEKEVTSTPLKTHIYTSFSHHAVSAVVSLSPENALEDISEVLQHNDVDFTPIEGRHRGYISKYATVIGIRFFICQQPVVLMLANKSFVDAMSQIGHTDLAKHISEMTRMDLHPDCRDYYVSMNKGGQSELILVDPNEKLPQSFLVTVFKHLDTVIRAHEDTDFRLPLPVYTLKDIHTSRPFKDDLTRQLLQLTE